MIHSSTPVGFIPRGRRCRFNNHPLTFVQLLLVGESLMHGSGAPSALND